MNAAAHHHSARNHNNIGIHIMQTIAWYGISMFGMGVPIAIALALVLVGV